MNREFKTHELELINGEIALINDNNEYKALKSTDYNFLFNKKTGFFVLLAQPLVLCFLDSLYFDQIWVFVALLLKLVFLDRCKKNSGGRI